MLLELRLPLLVHMRHVTFFLSDSTGGLKTLVSGKTLNSNAFALKASLCLLSVSVGDRECV